MADVLVLLAPLILLAIVVLFGFTGCGGEPFTSRDTPPDESEGPEPYHKAVEATSGFVALWPMNETSGTIATATSAIPNIDGVYLPGATPGSEGAFFQKEPNQNFAPDLNGTAGYVEVPFNQQLNPDPGLEFSVELWAKPAGALMAGVEQILVSSHHTSMAGNNRGYEIALVGTGAGEPTVVGRIFHIDAITTAELVPSSPDPAAWRHIVLTYDGQMQLVRVYATVADTAFALTYGEGTGDYSPVQAGGAGERPLRFGAGHAQDGAAEKFFAGRIDEVAFYNEVLPDATVEAHFNLF